MMPGHTIPPSVPFHPGRRHGDHHQYYQPPAQTHSPVHHNPYAAYPHPHYAPHASPYSPQPQWYGVNPYAQPQHHQYAMPPRQFQPHASPVVVSSHLHMAHLPPVNRAMGQTPPIVHSRTPPVARIPTPQRTPQPLPSTPSVHSQQALVSSPTPPTATATATPPPATPSVTSTSTSAAPVSMGTYMPFYPPLPWLSVADADFPPRASQKKRRRRAPVPAQEDDLALPSREQVVDVEKVHGTKETADDADHTSTEGPEESQASTMAPASEVATDTPQSSHPPSEIESTRPSASSPDMPAQPARASQGSHARTQTKPAVPLIPIKAAKAPSVTSTTQKSVKSANKEGNKPEVATPVTPGQEINGSAEETPKASPPPKAAPGSWAALLRSKNSAAAAAKAPAVSNGVAPTNGPPAPKSNSLGDVLASYSVDSHKKVSFLEPRGLVNTGNLCYMNSIFQVLIFCVPFYDFLDQYAKRVVHSFKSETPLVDAMIMFMRDFKVIDSADSVEKLRMRLKDNELEQYGEPLTPEYVYDVIRRLPRFDNMKRGQQEDAEEFLGFLLAGLHDECAHVIKSSRTSNGDASVTSPITERSDGGWLEVGPKQKASVTQSSGAVDIESPLTKIFGGKIRSEYKRPGEKPSVTLEPYQPLQLDIGSPNVNSIADALKGLTHLETLDGARGARASTKQMFIETLPPVLILHLKRFHYDVNGPQKIWKKIGYPLELDIPKEVFPQHKRSAFGTRGSPRYRLIGVVYHHGKNASGGHYTVDLRRQEGREWIRVDDTVIRRIRAEDVAEGGAEEDPKVLAAALEQHKNDGGAATRKNFFEQIGDDAESDRGGWSQVNGSENKKDKKWTGVVNGTATPSSAGKRTPLPKENVRDSKVAYILFYQRIDS